MKKTLIGVGLIVAFVVTVVLLKNNVDQPGSQATLSVITEEVSVKNINEDSFTIVESEVNVFAGSEIKTSVGGRAIITYPNGTITTIDSDSHLKITALDNEGQKSRIELVVGGVWARVKNVLATDEYYEIGTENVVASVRGTIFGVEHKNGISNTYGVESSVNVKLKDQTTGQVIDSTGVEVSSDEKVTVDQKSAPSNDRPLPKKSYNNTDYTRNSMKKMMEDVMEEEDLKDESVKDFMRKVLERNQNDQRFINRMNEKRLNILNTIKTPSSLPSKTPSPSPSASPIPETSESPEVSPSGSPDPNSTVSPTPVPSIDTSPILESVFPKSIIRGQKFTLNGKFFTVGRNTPQITGVTVGGTQAQFAILDSLTIFVTPSSNLSPGLYDVSVTTNLDSVLLLKQAITIK